MKVFKYNLNLLKKTEIEEEDDPVVVGEVFEEKIPKNFQLGISEDGSGWIAVQDPLNQHKTISNIDLSPKRNTDLSPKRRRHDSDDDDLSPPRKNITEDLSPKRKRHDSDNDLSPPRQQNNNISSKRHDNDLSPPRKQNSDTNKPVTMLSGTKAGLLSSEEITHEIKKKKQRMESNTATSDPSKLGKGAQTIYRDKKGKKLSINEILQQQEGKYIEDDEENMEWGKGLVQKQQKEDMKSREEEEKYKPFARSADDPELDDMYREVDRWGDPMLQKSKEESDQDESQDENDEEKEKKRKKEKKKKHKEALKPPKKMERCRCSK